MKITVPKNIDLPWTFAQCVTHIVDTCAGVRSGDRVANAVLGKVEGDEIEFAKEDAERLDASFNEPAAGYSPGFVSTEKDTGKQTPIPTPSRLFLTYIDAVSPQKE